MRRTACLLTLLALARVAGAESHTAREVEAAPLPDEESGRIDSRGDGDSVLRAAARGVLFVPELAFVVVTAPLRGWVWAEDRYKLGEHGSGPDRERLTLRIAPTFVYEMGFGAAAGVKLDAFGAHEHAVAQAIVGLGYRARAGLALDSGDRFGPLRLGLEAGYQRCPDQPFYGIGNGDLATPPAALIDPRRDPRAVETDHLLQQQRAALVTDLALADELHVIASTAVARLDARAANGDSIETVYDPAGLVGFGRTTTELYPELELRWDDRRTGSPWVPRSVHAAGSLVRAFAGPVLELRGGSEFWHYGGELQHYWRLGGTPRVVSVRLHGEAVTGSLDEVPFFELPSLGGDMDLRGYTYDRFRDRIAGSGAIQYQWGLSSYADAFLFVDAGRVYRDSNDLGVDHLRVGYGAGLVTRPAP